MGLAAAQLGPVVCADVREVDYSPHRGIDLLWASPPCQAWSSAGKRLGASDTERNGWPWTWEIVDQVAPQWLVEYVLVQSHHFIGEAPVDKVVNRHLQFFVGGEGPL